VNDLHARFGAWLESGEELPRDLAVHASGCDRCLPLAAGYDALRAIDVGLAPEPPMLLEEGGEAALLGPARAAAGLASLALVGAAVVLGTGMLRPSPGANGVATASTTPFAEGILGGVPATPTVAPDDTATPSPAGSPSPEPTPVPDAPTPAPTAAPVLTPVATPRPTPVPTAVPTPVTTPPPTASPTATAVPTGTPAPTPILTPSPSPSLRPTVPPPSVAPP
jgi:hypothetical protein